ncbi:hypothetical protein GpartN1_g6557.t1 [Galdieria partita]|uniref:AP-1 complex subunit gamma n=1 Tax=Galdieria partita TaxID=83374 RepID=A0A9C7Q210_9RHOD|nr:hypothetical protein GpartN1_g6557.t1 [Galdieria partita]
MEKEAKKLYKKTKEMFRDAKKTFYCKTLREVVKEFRSCKTTAEERALVKKESAQIRDLFKEGDTAFRRRNIAKLLFFHMQGYPTEFGQLECLKLCTSPKYKDKRVGYLGLLVLLDENQEVLTLVTNCILQDLQSNIPLVAGLALTAVGNVASAELIKDVFPLVEKHLQGKDPYLRKKALLAAVRICKKVPEYSNLLFDYMTQTLGEHTEEVVLTGLALAFELANTSPEYIDRLRNKVIPPCVNLLKELLSPSFDPELTISGITDPFLQVKLLQVLSAYGKGSKEAANNCTDVLIKILSNTDSSSNAGLAVIYECVRTVIAIRELPDTLRSLAVETLGGRLLNEAKDNNARYVSLQTLLTVVEEKKEDVKRYLDTILECLNDPDISIRRRALDLVYALTDSSNIIQLSRCFLEFLETCEDELKPDVARKLSDMADRYAPDIEWHVNCMARTLSLTDVLMPESLISLFIALISAKESVQEYAAKILFELGLQPYAKVNPQNTGRMDPSLYVLKPALEMVSIWVIGEFGYKLIEQGALSSEEVVNSLCTILHLSIRNTYDEGTKREVLLGGSVHSSSSLLREVVLSCLAKLYTRVMLSREIQERILNILRTYQTSLDLEVQQRACEYFQMMDERWNTFSQQIMASLPPIDYNSLRKKHLKGADTAPGANPRKELSESLVSLLLDEEEHHNEEPTTIDLTSWNVLDLGKDTQSLPNLSEHDLDGLLFSTNNKSEKACATKTIECGEHLNAELYFFKEHSPNFTWKVEFHFDSLVREPLKRFRLQIAVPKYMKIDLQPATGTTLEYGKEVVQVAQLSQTTVEEKTWQFKYRISYEMDSTPNNPITREGIFRDFPVEKR